MKLNHWRFVLLLGAVALACVFLVPGAGAAPSDPGSANVMGPSAVPDAPRIAIQRGGGPNPVCQGSTSAQICLYWSHVGPDAAWYEIYRSTQPYPVPGVAPANRIMDKYAVPYGSGGATVYYADDGFDQYAADGTVDTVQVIGNVQTNYFWAVQSRSSGGETSGPSNWVGEFDFGLVKGA